MKEKMKKDAKEAIIKALENGYESYYCDLHNEVFNTDYYVTGTHEAKEALEKYGVFDALDKIQEYEKDNFGEIYTDLSNPEKLVNMLYYIIGEEVLLELMAGIDAFNDGWNELATEETNQEILNAIR